MVESIHKYFQMGTIQWMSFPRKNVLDAIQRIASDDFFGRTRTMSWYWPARSAL